MPIAMSKEEWARIVRWTDENKEDPEAVRRREYVKHLDKTSANMTRSWPNSVENVNKRNEELRRARHEAAEQANSKFYKRYVKRKIEEQERLMYSARDIVFKNKDAPKLLLGAVIETVVQKERQEQLKFKAQLQKEAADVKRQDDDDIIRKAKEWHELMATRRQRRFDVNKQHQREILEQAHEVSERNRLEYETELEYQKIDNIKADQQMDALKQFDTNFKAAEKARIWSDMERSKRELEQRRREQAARDRMDERLQEVLLRSRARTERKRKQTEKEVKDEKLRVLEKISQKLESGDAARDAKEQANLDRAIAEKNAADEARRDADQRKLERFREARRESRRQFLADEARRLHEFNNRRQWDIMNRFKNVELYKEFQENLRKEKERKIKEYREDILKLWRERDERDARERAETRHFYGELALQKLRHADNQVLTHAAELLAEARRHHRPEHALMKARDRYCKLYRLYPMPDLPKSMKEHFKPYSPWDGSAPDPGYAPPPPPPPDRGPDAPDEPDQPDQPGQPGQPDEPRPAAEGPHHKRDGLQPIDQDAVCKRSAVVPEESVEDYKRVGRANGLQRRNAQTDLFLPPINVPCPNPECSCELQQK